MTQEVVGAVLCAGFGRRMMPITKIMPKPLIPFLNTPMLTYALNHLLGAGVTRVGINLHHLPDAIPPVCDAICAQFQMMPTYVREWEILGTAGGVRGLWQSLGAPDATLVVLNGDSIMNIDLAHHIEAHRASGAQATFVISPKAATQPGRIFLDTLGVLQGIREMRAPDAPSDTDLMEFDFVGVHILEPSFIQRIPFEPGCMMGDVYGPLLLQGERVHTSVMDGFWAALDNPTLYLKTMRQCLDEPSLFIQAPIPDAHLEGIYAYRPGAMHDDAKAAPPVLLGAHVTASAQATVGPYACVDGVDLEPGTCVKNAMLFGMGRVEGTWEDCVAVAGEVAASADLARSPG